MAQRQEAKSLQDILLSKRFKVTQVISELHENSFTPMSEMVIGPGRSSSYKIGSTPVLTLKVRPSSPNNPVKEVLFYGYSPVRKGEQIEVKIATYDEDTSNISRS